MIVFTASEVFGLAILAALALAYAGLWAWIGLLSLARKARRLLRRKGGR